MLCSYDSEKIENLFKMLGDEVDRRRRLFADYGGDVESYVKESGRQIESIVVVIHNFAAFVETFDDKEEAVSFLTREGTRYGIYFVLTAANAGAVRFRILQNFKQLFALQLNDTGEYAGLLGNTGGVRPSAYAGRGIYKTDAVREFQTARVAAAAENRMAFLREACAEMSAAWSGPGARHVPMLPERVTLETLIEKDACPDLRAVPIGIDARTLEVVEYDLRSHFITLVLSQAGETDGFIRGLAEVLSAKCDKRTALLDSADSIVADSSAKYVHIRGVAAVNDAVVELFEEMVMRNNHSADARASGEALPAFEERFFLVPALAELLDALSDQNRDRFTAMLLKCDSSLQAGFIFADTADVAASWVHEPWLRAHSTGVDGIWVGDGFAEQFALQTAKMTSAMSAEIGSQFGYVVKKSKPRLTKLLMASAAMAYEDATE